MPEMGGFEATAKIREIEANSNKFTPIIAVSQFCCYCSSLIAILR
jgi:CheY-like chemotaxis protein